MTTDPVADERAALAREAAADDYDRQWPLRTTLGNLSREGFISGWDAAMVYASRKASEGIEHLDGDECCHFQD
jgi:hypothetical protein